MYAIVDLAVDQVIPQAGKTELTFNSLKRVDLPGKVTVFSPEVGYEYPPQYGEPDEPPARYRLYEVAVVDQGTGQRVVSISDPQFDPVADTVTVTRTLTVPPASPEVSFDEFEARFGVTEWNAATDLVYEVEPVVLGPDTVYRPKRKALVQGLARAQARNLVDLLHPKTAAFMDALVTGGVLTAERRDEILTP